MRWWTRPMRGEEAHIIRVVMENPGSQGMTFEMINNHMGCVGPDEITNANQMITLKHWREKTFGGHGTTIHLDFEVWHEGEPCTRRLSTWQGLFGNGPIPHAEPD